MDRLTDIVKALPLNIVLITKAIIFLLIIIVRYQFAKINWLIVDPVTVVPSSWQLPRPNDSNNQSASIDFSGYQWFGQFNAEANQPKAEPKQVTDAPETRLKLTLSGLVASSVPENSMAIVEYQGKQATYVIDEKITGTQAVIHEIHPDRLILKNRGKYETLMLDGFDYNEQPTASNPKINNNRNGLSKDLAQTRDEILKNPGKITDYISITPVRGDKNKLKGYRLNPGRDSSLFRQSGLKQNDLAVAFNGFDLTDFSASLKVMIELKSMTDISISVERDGQIVDIQFAISQ